MNTLTIALAGNPNAGKTTLFNALTSDNQHVGNWPGKTVEKRTGFFEHRNHHIEIIDLPGVYSLSSYSPEEEITRDFIVAQDYDLVINVLDTSNLERNLYLTVQIRETGSPMLLLLNKIDLAKKKGYQINKAQLSAKLGGIPVLETAAIKGKGLIQLKDAILSHQLDQESQPA